MMYLKCKYQKTTSVNKMSNFTLCFSSVIKCVTITLIIKEVSVWHTLNLKNWQNTLTLNMK